MEYPTAAHAALFAAFALAVPACSGGSGGTETSPSTSTPTGTDATVGTAIDTSTSMGPTTSPTVTMTTVTSTATDSTGNTSSSFAMPSDIPSDQPCDLWNNDCPEGYKCTAWDADMSGSYDSTRCVKVVDDPAGYGEPCEVAEYPTSGEDTCADGSMCWYIDDESLTGTCLDKCTGSPDTPMCDDGFVCPISGEGVLNLCFPTCHPLDEGSCMNGFGCVALPNGSEFACVELFDTVGPGDPCEFVNVCAPGLTCVNKDIVPDCMGEVGCCTPWCDLQDPDCAAVMGTTCTPWFMEDPPPEYADLGACVSL